MEIARKSSVESYPAEKGAEASEFYPRNSEFAETGTHEVGFEGCVEVRHQAERYNPDKGDNILGVGKGKHTRDSLNMFGKLQGGVNKGKLRKAGGEGKR